MSAKTERMQRRHRQGGVIDFDADVQIKPGIVVIDGQKFAEAIDGRLVRIPTPKLDFTIRNGRVIR